MTMEVLWAVVVTETSVYVRKYGTDKKNEHTTSVFGSKVGACNCARKVAKHNGLKYEGSKVKWTDL